MEKSALITQALAFHDTLLDPDQRGLGGTIALTKLKRLLNKLGDLPDELSHLTPERLSDFRESNLRASADIALKKVHDASLDIGRRIDQLKYVEHYLNAIDAGWQAVGMTQRDYIALKFSLHCVELEQKATDQFHVSRYKEKTEGFLRNLLHDDILPDDDYEIYSRRLDKVSERQIDKIKEQSGLFVKEALQRFEKGDVHDDQASDLLREVRNSLRNSDLPRHEWTSLMADIEAREDSLHKTGLRKKYDLAVSTLHDEKAVEAIEEIANDLERDGCEWADIDLDPDDVEVKLLAFKYDAISKARDEAVNFQEKNDPSAAYRAMYSISFFFRDSDFSKIGKDTQEIKDFYKSLLKADIKAAFENATNDTENPRYALIQVEDIERRMSHEGLSWRDLDTALDKDFVSLTLSGLYVRAAGQETADYIQDRHEGRLDAAAWYLKRANAGWEAIAGFDAIKASARQNNHAIPELDKI